MPVPVLVVQQFLPHLPVNLPHHLRLPPRYRSCLHAQSVDPICTCALRSLGVSIYVDLVAVGHERSLDDAVPAAHRGNGGNILTLQGRHPRTMCLSLIIALLFLFLVLLVYLYIRLNDAKLMKLPDEVASAFSPHRISARDALEAAAATSETIRSDSKTFLPPRTGRRYIVVGGVRWPSVP